MLRNAHRFRESWWLDGLYENERGYYRFDGQIDAETFSAAAVDVGRNNAPGLLFDLYCSGSLDLEAHPSVVADAWSDAEYPERAVQPEIWVHLFDAAGYTHDGAPAMLPIDPITLYRGCTPDGREGMAWTSDLGVARRFAHEQLRGRPVGHVYAFDAPPIALLAYIHETGRHESEYVIDIAYLRGAVRLFEQ